MKPMLIRGVALYKNFLAQSEQEALIHALRPVVKAAPLFSPTVAGGRKMSVRMTSAGALGWVSDGKGYRYQTQHPKGTEWPGIPETVLEIWRSVTGLEQEPDCCLLNYYGENARMGLHQDRDEADFSFPVVSISLGDDGLFRIGSQISWQ